MSDRTTTGTSDQSKSAWEETKGDLASGWENIKERTEATADELTRDHETAAEEFDVVDDDEHRQRTESRPGA